MSEEKAFQSSKKKNCPNCGAEVRYKPGSKQLQCAYCQYTEEIQTENDTVEELDLIQYLQDFGEHQHTEKLDSITCKNCGAAQHIEEKIESMPCAYCSEPLLRKSAEVGDWISPNAILPFVLNQKDAISIFKKWVEDLWFVPNALKKAALDPTGLKGIYLPYWTFDATLESEYEGRRGDYYYVTQSYTDSNGKRQTRQVQKTSWKYVNGFVMGHIDDLVIGASHENIQIIPKKISRWDLKNLQPYNRKFLLGYVTEKYTISLKDGFKKFFDEALRIGKGWARKQIGGDVQEVHRMKNYRLLNKSFKHVLLPLYICNYEYKGKRYNFYINGENGLIKGDRPYSFWKIFLSVLVVILVGLGFFLIIGG